MANQNLQQASPLLEALRAARAASYEEDGQIVYGSDGWPQRVQFVNDSWWRSLLRRVF